MMLSWCFHILAVICFLLYGLSLLNLRISHKDNHCEMTYMYEYPQAVHITVPGNDRYPRYGLYAYSEGRLTEKARKMKFDGVPVLFLHGNAGNHMQVRSLASVALRMALSSHYNFHFDFFTVNFNEELSGLYGGVLEDQTGYAILCMQRILSLYKLNKHIQEVPNKVILIGHSMGGVIAMRLLGLSGARHMTGLALALASPLRSPVLAADAALQRYYARARADWASMSPSLRAFRLLLSVGGGAGDLLVPAPLLYTARADLTALATALPGVWVAPDHLAVVWCKQLVLRLVRFLFAALAQQPGAQLPVSLPKRALLQLARQHFQPNHSVYLHLPPPPHSGREVALSADGFWHEDSRRQYHLNRTSFDKLHKRCARGSGRGRAAVCCVQARDWLRLAGLLPPRRRLRSRLPPLSSPFLPY